MDDQTIIFTLEALMKKIYDIEASIGWHDKPDTLGDRLSNITAEIGETWEEWRRGKKLDETYYHCKRPPEGDFGTECAAVCSQCTYGKPCGIPSELADIVIWLFDYCYAEKIPIAPMILEKLKFNATRPYRHGKKV